MINKQDISVIQEEFQKDEGQSLEKKHSKVERQNWAQTTALQAVSCVPLGKLLTTFESQIPYS